MPLDHLFDHMACCARDYLDSPSPHDGHCMATHVTAMRRSHATSYLTLHSRTFDDWGPPKLASLPSCAHHPEDPSCRPFAPDATLPISASPSGKNDSRTQIMIGNLPEGTKQIAVTLQDGIDPTRKPQWLVVGNVKEKWNTRNVAESALPSTQWSRESVQLGLRKAAEKRAQCMEEEGFDEKKLTDCKEGCTRFQRVAAAGSHEPAAHSRDSVTDCTNTCDKDAAHHAEERRKKCHIESEKEFCHYACAARCQNSSHKDACQDPCERKCAKSPTPTTAALTSSSPDYATWRPETCYDACREHTRDQCSDRCSHATVQLKAQEIARGRDVMEGAALQCTHRCEHAACLKNARASVAEKHACTGALDQCRRACAAKGASLQADIKEAPVHPPGSIDRTCFRACMNEIPVAGLDAPIPAQCYFDCKPVTTGVLGSTLPDTFEGTVSAETSHPSTFRELHIPYTNASTSVTDPWIHPQHFRVYALNCDSAQPFPRAYAARGKEHVWEPPSLQVWQALQRDMRDCILDRQDLTVLGVARAPLAGKAALGEAQGALSMKELTHADVPQTASNSHGTQDFSQRLDAIQVTDDSDITAQYKRDVEEA